MLEQYSRFLLIILYIANFNSLKIYNIKLFNVLNNVKL